MRKEGVVWKIFNALVIVMGLLLILGPVWVIFINSMKTMQEAGQDFFALPSRLNFDNYVELFTRSDFWSSLRNSVIVTVSSVALVVIFVPALAYAVARNMEKRYYKILRTGGGYLQGSAEQRRRSLRRFGRGPQQGRPHPQEAAARL